MAAEKIKVKPVPFDEMTNWEIHLFEEACGYGLDALQGWVESTKPKHILYITMMWVALRRTMGEELTLEQVGKGPWELERKDDELSALAEAAAVDPKGQPVAETDGSGLGVPSSIPT